MPRIYRPVARILVVCVWLAGLPTPAAQAELIATDRVQATEQARTARAHLGALLDRADVRAALQRNGVSPEDAKARVAALSDDEIEHVAAKFDSLPAGGDGIEGVLWLAFLVFVILLITEIQKI